MLRLWVWILLSLLAPFCMSSLWFAPVGAGHVPFTKVYIDAHLCKGARNCLKMLQKLLEDWKLKNKLKMVWILRNVQGLAGIEPWTFWLWIQLAIHYTKEPAMNSVNSADCKFCKRNEEKTKTRPFMSHSVECKDEYYWIGKSIYIAWNSVFMD